MDTNLARSLPLGRLFAAGRQSFTVPPLSPIFEYAVVSPEQTPGYLGLGTTVKFSSFLHYVLGSKI